MTLISITFLFVSVPEVLGQFCPDAGTVYSTTDQAEGDAPIVVRACDIDTDGDPDLITANDGSHTVSVLINDGNGTYAAPLRWTTTTTPFDPICCQEPVDFDCCTEPVDVACCDINGDTHVDLVTVNHTSDDVSVLLNDGSMQFAAPVRYTVGEAPFGIECLNLDGDIDNDLVTNGFTEDAISVLLNNGDGTFAAHVTYAAGDAPIAMTLCNVDGDGDDDVVTANMLSKDVSVLRNNADGTFTNIGSAGLCTGPTECVNPFDIACCDFDGVDGPDVATANGIADTLTVLFNDGAGGFGGVASYNNLDGAYGVTCCDLDGDADVDVVSANLVSDDLAVFLNEGAGSFGAPSFLTVGTDSTANPSSVICSDVDGDLDTDLMTTFVDGVTLFENDCGGGVCGDGVVDPGEECDDGGESATCDADCTFVVCGDGTRNTTAGEECDDGNTIDGDCCSAVCMIEDCPCQAPAVSGGGSRYLAIRPKPHDSTVPVKLRVKWPAGGSPCFSRYVGSLRCGGVGEACTNDADCNECRYAHVPCLGDEDCDSGICLDGQACSVTQQNCTDQSECVRNDFCDISGDLCEAAPLATIDINKDGLIDGTLAVLVEEARASEFSPMEWTAGVMRCGKSAAACVGDGDCPRGQCVTTGAFCNVFRQDCMDGAQCVLDEECMSGAVYVYGEDIVPSEFIAETQTHLPTTYEVSAVCAGVESAAVSAAMWRWADTNNDTYINVSDIQLIILAIQGHYDFSSVVSDDLSGSASCWVQQIINITDVLFAKRAFQGENYFETDCNHPTCP